MTIETLLAELETLPFAARLSRMIALGRESRTDAGTEALLRSLGEAGDFYGRHLRLLSCIGSRGWRLCRRED